MSTVLRWFFPPLPRARVAVVRAIIGTFALLNALFLLRSPLGRVHTPEFYDPVALARLLHLPAPTEVTAYLALAGIAAGALGLVLGGRRSAPPVVQHSGGVLLAVGYLAWCLWGMSFGHVAHDHMAIAVAVLVLPTAGTCRYGQSERSEAAGWSLRMVQIFTVALIPVRSWPRRYSVTGT